MSNVDTYCAGHCDRYFAIFSLPLYISNLLTGNNATQFMRINV